MLSFLASLSYLWTSSFRTSGEGLSSFFLFPYSYHMEKLRYRALVLDHDDTVVDSTATIHYPSFMAFMRKKRPGFRLTLDEYLAYNFDPGVLPFFTDICGLNRNELQEEEAFWVAYVKEHVPSVFPGIKSLLLEQKRRGGLITVVSHSFGTNVLRDYRLGGLPEPDRVFGWEVPSEKRKPCPWALERIMEEFHLEKKDLLVVDDLKPGLDMASSAGVSFAAAGWAHTVPMIEAYMRSHSGHYFRTVEELYRFLFPETEGGAG